MVIKIGAEIRVQDASKELYQWCGENLIIPNPEYTNRARRGLWLGKTPQYLWLYWIDGSDLVIPVGVGKELRRFIDDGDIFEVQVADNGLLQYDGKIPLYDYQEPAVREMTRQSCGILQSPCGSGKTQMGIDLAARYKYGLSATVHRSDGMIKSTFAVLGPVIYRVPDEAVAEKTMKVRVVRRETGVKTNLSCLDTDGTLKYNSLLGYLTGNADRNGLIARDLESQEGHSCLVLSSRLEHLKEIRAMLPDRLRERAVMIDGSMTSKRGKQQREQAIEDMRSGKKDILFASFGLAKEGLDIPCLDRLFLISPQKDYAVVTQSIGRIARVATGKEDAVCYDYVDSIAFCENQWKRRRAHYRKAGCIL